MEIDLVYLWVNGDDETWAKKKAHALSKRTGETLSKDSVDKCRFQDNDELKYSLRSVEKYAPWINKIYIVTDNQIPEWLNTDNKKIKIVDHKEILPEDALPTFNSSAIETRITKIPNLSEYFLFANDDMLFFNEVEPSFFFTKDGEPICRMGKKILNKEYKHYYGRIVNNAYLLMKSKYGAKTPPYFLHHGIDSYRKSYVDECIKEFQQELDNTMFHHFRENDDIQRVLYTHYSVIKKGAKLVKPKALFGIFNINEDGYANCRIKDLKRVKNSKYPILCINDGRKTTAEDIEYMILFLNEKFPKPSEFEKQESRIKNV